MNYSMNKDQFAIKEILFDGCQEQPIDVDFSLPDYCPDIRRILKCQVCPQINMKNVVSDRLDIEGFSLIKLIYVDSIKNTIRCCEYKEPFSVSFSLDGPSDEAIVSTKVKVEYVNCRAVSPRRLDIHGSFSICAKIFNKLEQEIVSGIAEEDLQQKKENKMINNVIGIGNQQFSISEVLNMGENKPKLESIINSNVHIDVTSVKPIANKLIVKADAVIKILYLSDIDTGNIESAEFNIPVSQMVDVPGVNEDSTYDIKIEVLNSDIRPKSDSFGEEDLLSVDIRASIIVVAFEKKNMEIVTDVYSTKYSLETDYKQFSAPKSVELISEVYKNKSTAEISVDGISEIIDVFNEYVSVNAKCEEDKINFKGKMNVCILALDENSEPLYAERILDFEYQKDLDNNAENVLCDVDASLKSINFRISTKNSIEINSEIKINADIIAVDKFKAINEIMADEENVNEKDASLTIYYADKGESIWDIARKYSTSVDAIKEENELEGDVLEKRGMLLIPM